MFKYIADIIKQFTPQQRILALLMLLLAITIISVTPTIAEAIAKDPIEYGKQIKARDKRIDYLELTIDTLDLKIRTNQRHCTNEIADRELEFNKMLDEILSDVRRGKSAVSNRQMVVRNPASHQDTLVARMEVAPIRVIDDNPILDGIEGKLKAMKKRIKKTDN
jgi:hypothetical protein